MTNLAFRWGNGTEGFEVFMVSSSGAEEVHNLEVAEKSGVRVFAVCVCMYVDAYVRERKEQKTP